MVASVERSNGRASHHHHGAFIAIRSDRRFVKPDCARCCSCRRDKIDIGGDQRGKLIDQHMLRDPDQRADCSTLSSSNSTYSDAECRQRRLKDSDRLRALVTWGASR